MNRTNNGVIIPIDKYNYIPSFINQYYKNSIPVILNVDKDGEIYDEYNKMINSEEISNGDKLNIIINFKISPQLRKLHSLFIPGYFIYSTIFSGKYKGGQTHIDATFDYNIYWVHKGKKRVYIIPKEFNSLIPKNIKKDFIYSDYEIGTNPDSWIYKLPYYYSANLEEKDILLFDNGNCFHSFTNLNQEPSIVISSRYSCYCVDWSLVYLKMKSVRQHAFNISKKLFGIDYLREEN